MKFKHEGRMIRWEIFAALLLLATGPVSAQDDPFGGGPAGADPFGDVADPFGAPPAAKPNAEDAAGDAETDTDDKKQPITTIGGGSQDPTAGIGQRFEIELRDGTCLRGELQADEILISTKYGKLTVPVQELTRITPGLNTRKSLRQRVAQLLTDLGGDDFRGRDVAQEQLLELGPSFSPVLRDLANADNAEQSARLRAIFDEYTKLEKTWGPSAGKSMQLQDQVTTREFTASGQVLLESITIHGLYGTVSVDLELVKSIRRAAMVADSDLYHTANVTGAHMVASEPLETQIDIRRGDVISIRAGGTIRRSSSSSYTSYPDGSSNLGTVQSSPRIYGGTLMVKVGKSNEFVPSGSQTTFTADRDGKLFLGIAMHPNYLRYTYEGAYDVKVRVSRER